MYLECQYMCDMKTTFRYEHIHFCTVLHKKLGISKNGSKYIYGKNDLFSVVITFRYLLPKTDFLLFKKQLWHIFDRYQKQNLNLKLNDLFEYMGFPCNWKEITKFRKI